MSSLFGAQHDQHVRATAKKTTGVLRPETYFEIIPSDKKRVHVEGGVHNYVLA